MSRDEIYEQLMEQIPNLKRRECTARVMADADILLDKLIEIQIQEEFDRVFGGTDNA